MARNGSGIVFCFFLFHRWLTIFRKHHRQRAPKDRAHPFRNVRPKKKYELTILLEDMKFRMRVTENYCISSRANIL